MKSRPRDTAHRASRLVVKVTTMLVAIMLSAPGSALADLQRDAEVAVQRWRADGHRVVHVTSAFLLPGGSKTLRLPASRQGERPCVTVVALAVRGVPFRLDWAKAPDLATRTTGEGTPGDAGEADRSGGARATGAGVATLASCKHSKEHGGRAPRAEAVTVSFGSSRGAVEVIAIDHRGEVTPIEEVLVERSTGHLIHSEAPLLLPLAPLDERLRSGVRVARFDGAVDVVTAESESDPNGLGAVVLRLSRGCHRLGVLADADDGGAADVDVELRVEDSTEPFRKDNSHAPDARVELCLEDQTPVELRWRGARPERRILLFDARWPSPVLPRTWPEPMRVGVSGAMWRRRTPAPSAPPLGSWIATSGRTVLPIAVDPGSCYLAAAAERTGEPSSIRLRIEGRSDGYQDDASERPLGAAIVFCAGPMTRVRAVLDVRGAQASVGFSLFHVLGRPR